MPNNHTIHIMSPGSILIILFILIIAAALLFVRPSQSGGGPFKLPPGLEIFVLQAKGKKFIPNFICLGEQHVSTSTHVGLTRSGMNFVRMLAHDSRVHKIVIYNEAVKNGVYKKDINMAMLMSPGTFVESESRKKVPYYPNFDAQIMSIDVDSRHIHENQTIEQLKQVGGPDANWLNQDDNARLFDYMFSPNNPISPLHDLTHELLDSTEFRNIYVRLRTFYFGSVQKLYPRATALRVDEISTFFINPCAVELRALCKLLTDPREEGTIPIFAGGAAHVESLIYALEPYTNMTRYGNGFDMIGVCPSERYFVDAILKGSDLPSDDPTKIISFNLYAHDGKKVMVIVPISFQEPELVSFMESVQTTFEPSIYSSSVEGSMAQHQGFGRWLIETCNNIDYDEDEITPPDIYRPYFESGKGPRIVTGNIHEEVDAQLIKSEIVSAAEQFLHAEIGDEWHLQLREDRKYRMDRDNLLIRSLERIEKLFRLDFVEKCQTTFCVVVSRSMSIPDLDTELKDRGATLLMSFIDSRNGLFELPTTKQIQDAVDSNTVFVRPPKTASRDVVKNTLDKFEHTDADPPWITDFTYPEAEPLADGL